MTILWCGSEQADFISLDTKIETSTYYLRQGFSRLVHEISISELVSKLITPTSSVWLSFCKYVSGGSTYMRFGLRNFDNNAFIGLCVNSPSRNIELFTYDGTTRTVLTTGSLSISPVTVYKYDMQVSNYGPSGSVNVWVDGLLDIQYSGNIAVNGQTTLDCFHGYNESTTYKAYISEMIIADEDTRLMSLVTLTPNAAGDTNNWNGTYENIDELEPDNYTINTDTVEDDVQLNLSNLPVGDFQVKAVSIAYIAADVDANRGIQAGVKTNGALHLGSTESLEAGWGKYNNILYVNPETSNPFTLAEIDALQLAFRSKTP